MFRPPQPDEFAKPPPASNIRIDQLGFEVCGVLGSAFVDSVRVNQLGFEVLGTPVVPFPSNIRIDQLGFEVCGVQPSGLRVNQLGVEVCGVPLIDDAFIVTQSGNMLLDTMARVHFKGNSRGLVDSGAWLRVRNVAHWSLLDTTCEFTQYAIVNAIGATKLTAALADFRVQGGLCFFGSSSDAATIVQLGNGTDAASLRILGTLGVDDASALVLGTMPGASGPAELTIGTSGNLQLVNALFNLVGTLDIEAPIRVVGQAPGDGVATTGLVVASFSALQQTGGVFFTDASYAPVPVTWAWTFGDGVTSGLQNPVHEYAKPGAYVVTLTIAAPGGSSTATQTITVTE